MLVLRLSNVARCNPCATSRRAGLKTCVAVAAGEEAPRSNVAAVVAVAEAAAVVAGVTDAAFIVGEVIVAVVEVKALKIPRC